MYKEVSTAGKPFLLPGMPSLSESGKRLYIPQQTT